MTDQTQVRVYPDLNDGNAQEILLFLLSGGSIRKGHDILSTHPLQVNGVNYTPYKIIQPTSPHDMPYPKSGSAELERLYQQNVQAAKSFWRGLDGILGNVEDVVSLGALGRFGLGEMLNFLSGYAFPFDEDTQGASQKVKSLVDRRIFTGQSAQLYPHFHGINFEAKEEVSDLRVLITRAYTYLQRGESVDYWMNMAASQPQYADLAFRGLAFCDLDVAQNLLANSEKLRELSLDPDSAGVNLRAAQRARQKAPSK